jgi:hypothetical protein
MFGCPFHSDFVDSVDSLLTAVKDRLREATMAENFGILVEACVEAAALYP